jgi:hypothetical protein
MNATEQTPAGQADDDLTGGGWTRPATRHRWTLLAITLAVLVVATGYAVYQRVAPEMRLKADGFSKVGTVQHYDVWAKTRQGELSLRLRNGDVTMCQGGGPFEPTGYPVCQEGTDGRSALVGVVPVGAHATVVTGPGSEVPATVLHPQGWPYALAVLVADDESLLTATLK